ncbi:FAD-dependent monooxygenase [uncultured Halopseudomonas sp.]|uniref:FAD-dependent monooxygenase n=1 Tax=uncultured Halopseudomonas sp. TaxID=2901193 RepID=UPI0030EE1D43|tara:strand:- start:427 stop:1683 length:1257 start_codon:yes stop_codon:yes gene_type:complete
MPQDYDLIIVGGGMVGATLALALADTELNIALVDALPLDPQPARPAQTVSGYDSRVSAVSAASERIFTRLGVWPLIDSERRCAYQHMCVWDAEGTGEIRFDALALNESRLGHIVENVRLQQALLGRLEQTSVDMLGNRKIETLVREDAGWRLKLVGGEALCAPLVVAADGARSKVRELAGFALREWDYLHHAIVTTVQVAEPHQATAWQRFLPTGPLAFLPLPDRAGEHYCSIVWSLLPEAADRVMALDDAAFAREVGAAIEDRLGQVVAVDPRFRIELRQRHAKTYAMQGLVLVGDAAHTIHPLAGQGVNLGLLDAAELNDVLRAAIQRGEPLADLDVLQRYERRRMGANLGMMAAMEGFERLFHANALPLRWLRNAGMQWLDQQAKLKSVVIRRAMGLDGDLPSLAGDPELDGKES